MKKIKLISFILIILAILTVSVQAHYLSTEKRILGEKPPDLELVFLPEAAVVNEFRAVKTISSSPKVKQLLESQPVKKTIAKTVNFALGTKYAQGKILTLITENGPKPSGLAHISPQAIYDELMKSEVGRETLMLIYSQNLRINLFYNTAPMKNMLGFAIGNDSLIFVENCGSLERTTSTIIHEVTHTGLRIRGTQRDEVIAFMRGEKHLTSLSIPEIRSIIEKVKLLYSHLPYKR